jgi:hypothetical protein
MALKSRQKSREVIKTLKCLTPATFNLLSNLKFCSHLMKHLLLLLLISHAVSISSQFVHVFFSHSVRFVHNYYANQNQLRYSQNTC